MQYFIPSKLINDIRTNNEDLNIISFKRHYLDNIRYHHTLSTINDKYSYIIKKFFDSCNDSEIVQKISIDGEHINMVITTNSFSYSRPKAMDQYLIWVDDNNLTTEDVIKYIDKYINGKNYIIWTNSTTIYSSMPEIKHFHLMIQNISPKLILKKVIIIARHGPRTPLEFVPKLETACWKYYKPGEMTKEGIDYCHNFGKYIKELYGHILKFNKDNIIAKSSDSDRTIMTAKYFFKGLFDDSFNANISTDKKTYCSSKLTIEDMNLFEDFSKKIKLDLRHQVLEYVTRSDVNLINEKILKLFGYKINNTNEYYLVHSILQCYSINNKHLIPKEWTVKDWELLEYLTTFFYSKLFENKNFVSMFTDGLFELINNIIKDPAINFAFICTHDSNIYSLASKLANTIVKLPYFCSCIRFEIWDAVTRIYYDDLLLTEYKVDIKEFKKITDNHL